MTNEELRKMKELTKAANGLANSLRMLGKHMNENANYVRRWSAEVQLSKGTLRELL